MKPKKFTVLLLYPQEQDGEKVETFQAHVLAFGRHGAIVSAHHNIWHAEPEFAGQEMQVLAVYRGHREDIKPDYEFVSSIFYAGKRG